MKASYLKKAIFLGIVFLCFLIISPVFAATLGVPGTYSTIQAAINAASSGDTVLVSAGTYVEALTLADGVTLRSVSDASSTILDGTDLGDSIVEMASNSTIDGFTLQNGTTGTLYLGAVAGNQLNSHKLHI